MSNRDINDVIYFKRSSVLCVRPYFAIPILLIYDETKDSKYHVRTCPEKSCIDDTKAALMLLQD